MPGDTGSLRRWLEMAWGYKAGYCPSFWELTAIEKIELIAALIVAFLGVGAIMAYIGVLIGVLMGWLQ